MVVDRVSFPSRRYSQCTNRPFWAATSVIRQIARLAMGFGVALLFMALVVRLAEPSHTSLAGDDFAIAASALLALLGAVVTRFGPD